MIPKTIHYCWFGGNPKPPLAEKCIKSWQKYCPDFEIIEWNEDNFDISSCPLYVRQAYDAKKWAFVTDYVRLKIVYDHGGIYLDTDVELFRSPEAFLSHRAYFGFEQESINTGIGFGAEKGHPLIKEIMDDYNDVPFIKEDGSFDTETCPSRNTKVILRHGLQQDDSRQVLEDDVLILPTRFFCPLDYNTGKLHRTKDTVSVHWFDASWRTAEEKAYHERKLKAEKRDRLIHTPQRAFRKLLGEKGYEKLKSMFHR